MSKLLENKQQMIHIASEVVVLIGLTFYFNQQNKKLTGHIEDLAQRIEEQEDLIQNHENVIKQLVEQVNLLAQRQQNMLSAVPQPQVAPKPQPALRPKPKTRLPKHTEPPLSAPVQTRLRTEARAQFQEPKPAQKTPIDTHAVIAAQMARRDHDEPPPQRNTIDVNAIMQQQSVHREQEDTQYFEDSEDEDSEDEDDLDQELADELEDLDDDLKKE